MEASCLRPHRVRKCLVKGLCGARSFRPRRVGGLQPLVVLVVVALGRVAHDSLCRGLGLKASALKFAHGAVHQLPNGMLLIDSYHCSRYNQNTGRLTAAMLEALFEKALQMA